ncbi:DUF2514 family protein [Pseudomonas kuykendallii]|uniref:DUF2514 family protein n=1 Tax=Pseudomonas kuykendallii TaxID=1007099 RepID=UPI0028D29824|nr:DUF2514 family protein [Pseudomonas kuykendallii]
MSLVDLVPAQYRVAAVVGGILLLIALLAAALYSSYQHGVTVTNDSWALRWSQRDVADVEAARTAEAKARGEELRRQSEIDRVSEDAQHQIDQAGADARDAAAAADSLRGAAGQLVQRLADSEAGRSSCTATASAAATRAARVLADVLQRADERAGRLAAIADEFRARGLACERTYGALTSPR